MFLSKEKVTKIFKLVSSNTLKFIFIMLFIGCYIIFFGISNVLVGVGVVVALMSLPACNVEVKPVPMAILISVLFTSMGIIAALSILNPWLGFFINFLFIFLIMIVSCEPSIMKPYISLLLCYIFAQTLPVHGKDLILRIIGLTIGGILIAGSCLIQWQKKRYDINARTLTQQIVYSFNNYAFILRMSIGVAGAMFLADILHLQKPLWISIVVMSLTQIKISDTIGRIKHRSIGTGLGIILFIVLFRIIVPPEYSMILVLMLGYLCTYVSQYKHTQTINTISAINASMILMDTFTAIENRVFCLILGILIVILFHAIEEGIHSLFGTNLVFNE